MGFQGTHSAVPLCPGTDLLKCFAFTNGQVAGLRNFRFGENSSIVTLGGFMLLLISEQKIQNNLELRDYLSAVLEDPPQLMERALPLHSDFGKQRTWVP